MMPVDWPTVLDVLCMCVLPGFRSATTTCPAAKTVAKQMPGVNLQFISQRLGRAACAVAVVAAVDSRFIFTQQWPTGADQRRRSRSVEARSPGQPVQGLSGTFNTHRRGLASAPVQHRAKPLLVLPRQLGLTEVTGGDERLEDDEVGAVTNARLGPTRSRSVPQLCRPTPRPGSDAAQCQRAPRPIPRQTPSDSAPELCPAPRQWAHPRRPVADGPAHRFLRE